jgi:tRNA A-37 threonylcarbamoyl transferase component Bud32
MSQVPFSITINPVEGDTAPQTLRCIAVLRAMGRKRNVYDAVWQDRPVIVKLFSDPIKARYHAQREWRGLKILQKRGLQAPEPLIYGKNEKIGWAVVTDQLNNAETALELFDSNENHHRKVELVSIVVDELAKQHNKGVIQKDLHLGNFIIRGTDVFSLDPAQIRFIQDPVPKSKSIDHVALLTSIIPSSNRNAINEIFQRYADARSWQLKDKDWALFDKQLIFWKKTGLQRSLRKCLRTNRRHQRIKYSNWYGMATKDFYESGDIEELTRKIDDFMQAGHILKDGNTCFVSHTNWAGTDIVIKRYNHKSLYHSFRHTVKRSRARRNWLHANRLSLLDIPTPKPLAYLECKKGLLIWKSYYITQYVASQNLHVFLNDKELTEDRRQDMLIKVEKLLDKLTRNRITHGDLKQTNILITQDGPVLTDLDSMKIHRYNWIMRDRREDNMKRLSGGS